MATKQADSVSIDVTTIDGAFAEQLLNHLVEETASFAAMLDAVRGVHTALQKLDDELLGQFLEAERRELVSILSLQERRHELQQQLAPRLNLAPKEVTLRRLIRATSGALKDAIERGWKALSEMAAELDRLNRQNAAMIKLSMSIAKGVLERLTGFKSVGESYGATGAKTENHVGPLIQWGG